MTYDRITQHYLNLCYNCDYNHECQTEEECLACWTEQGLLTAEDDGQQETRRWMQMAND
ncbi:MULTISPECIES: hypothetical protein [Paenibacillus]|uniref:hypothetical protein n=1 Tax=Paenibacillus TaxID=44249 RepID=UPI00159501A3|nr:MULTISPECIES: hypothetical protein [Paenibacillus]